MFRKAQWNLTKAAILGKKIVLQQLLESNYFCMSCQHLKSVTKLSGGILYWKYFIWSQNVGKISIHTTVENKPPIYPSQVFWVSHLTDISKKRIKIYKW